MRVLVACEFSGVVRDAFAALGHDAWSCDLLPTEKPGQHYQGDIFEILDQHWDLLVAHPPCTYLANSGIRWLHTETGRYEKMLDAAQFFKALLLAPIEKICIENPVMHPEAKMAIGIEQTQTIQPWQFGHPEQKLTCLWLKNLPLLHPTKDVYHRMMALPRNERESSFHAA